MYKIKNLNIGLVGKSIFSEPFFLEIENLNDRLFTNIVTEAVTKLVFQAFGFLKFVIQQNDFLLFSLNVVRNFFTWRLKEPSRVT